MGSHFQNLQPRSEIHPRSIARRDVRNAYDDATLKHWENSQETRLIHFIELRLRTVAASESRETKRRCRLHTLGYSSQLPYVFGTRLIARSFSKTKSSGRNKSPFLFTRTQAHAHSFRAVSSARAASEEEVARGLGRVGGDVALLVHEGEVGAVRVDGLVVHVVVGCAAAVVDEWVDTVGRGLEMLGRGVDMVNEGSTW
eukprot:6179583-Pleurochrysis_carterae.AAC.5